MTSKTGPADPGGGAKARILIADDEPNLRLLYQSELEAEGYRVVTAADGKEALEAIEKERPDLVVLDIRMPGMDGVETLNRIIDKYRTLPVILNTAFSNYQDSFMTWPADAYVVKSSDISELKRRIAEVLAKPRKG